MPGLISRLKSRRQSWSDYYHLKSLPDRLLEEIAIESGYLAQIRKDGINRRPAVSADRSRNRLLEEKVNQTGFLVKFIKMGSIASNEVEA